MKTATHRRWWIWLPLLAVAAWLALTGERPAAPEVAQPTRTVRVVPAAGERASMPLKARDDTLVALVSRDALLARGEGAGEGPPPASRDLFSTRNWTPPAPPPAPVAPPPPQAPPLPFTFVGKKLEGDTWEVYLAQGERTYVARAGQVLEGSWRVDQVSPPTIAFTYLPLEQKQSLPIGDSR